MNIKQFFIAYGILMAFIIAWVWFTLTHPRFWDNLPWPVTYSEPSLIERTTP